MNFSAINHEPNTHMNISDELLIDEPIDPDIDANYGIRQSQQNLIENMFNLENQLKMLSLSASSSSSCSSSNYSANNGESPVDDIAFFNLKNLINFFDNSNSNLYHHNLSSQLKMKPLTSKIISGFAGRAKNQENQTCETNTLTFLGNNKNNETLTVNFGDDVGFILNKNDQ